MPSVRLYRIGSLEVQFAVDTKHTVGTGEGVADEGCGAGDTVIVLVVRLEVSCTKFHVVVDGVLESKADAAGINHERHIVHVGIGKLIARDLCSSRDRETVGNVPLYTTEVLIGASVEQFLGVVIPMGIGVVITCFISLHYDFYGVKYAPSQ